MIPYTIKFSYNFTDARQQVWEELKPSVPQLIKSVAANSLLLFMSIFVILNFNNILIPLFILLYSGYNLAYLLLTCVAPVAYYLRIKRYGEVTIEYSERGITTSTRQKTIHSTWDSYIDLKVNNHSYIFNRKDSLIDMRVPNRVFNTSHELEKFVSNVRKQLTVS